MMLGWGGNLAATSLGAIDDTQTVFPRQRTYSVKAKCLQPPPGLISVLSKLEEEEELTREHLT